MIYDRTLQLAHLGAGASPMSRRLVLDGWKYYAPETVYASRYYSALQAGVRLDLVAFVAEPDAAEAGQYAIISGDVYRIERAEAATDEHGLPITMLTLHKEDDKFELLGTADASE